MNNHIDPKDLQKGAPVFSVKPRSAALHFAVLAVLLILFPLFPAAGQEIPTGTAILIRGPLERQGVPLGFPNAVSCRYGVYSWEGQEVEVFFVELDLELDGRWISRRCGRFTLRERSERDGAFSYYPDPRGWGGFITRPAEEGGVPCPFVEKFLDRLSYFQAISDSFSFPAVLEISAP